MNRYTVCMMIITTMLIGANAGFGQEKRDPAIDRYILKTLRELAAESDTSIARNEKEKAAPVSPLTSPAMKVKTKDGGYRLSMTVQGGENRTIVAEADEAEIEGTDLNAALMFARERSKNRDVRMVGDIEKVFKDPLTRIITETRIVTQSCPTPSCQPTRASCYTSRASCYTRPATSSCCGQHGTSGCTCGTRTTSTCSCGGIGCSSCRTSLVSTGTYGRCAAWGRVYGTPLSCYRDPPPGRQWWCNCPEHINNCRRLYGSDCVWELVPCGCGSGCTQCGGAGRCGQH